MHHSGLSADIERLEAAAHPLVVGDPYAAVAKVLGLRQSCFQTFSEHDVPSLPSEPIGLHLGDLTLFMPPNGYKGSHEEWTLEDVEEWLLLLPRPGTVQGDLLAVFKLHDGRFVYIRALSDYYSGFWQGIAVRVYIALELETLEEYGMGFEISGVQRSVATYLVNGGIAVDSLEHREAWQAMSASLCDIDKWLVCNEDFHSDRRGNRAGR